MDTSPSAQLAGRAKMDFLESLARDLRVLGHEIGVSWRDSCPEFVFGARDLSSLTQAEILAVYETICNNALRAQIAYIQKMESSGVLDHLVDGRDLQVGEIRPEVRICRTRAQKDIFRYCRYLQRIPNSTGVGRRFGALVYDVGQRHPALMGAIGFSSAIYALGCRDSFLTWDRIASKQDAKRTREFGLQRLMQLSVCMALPPYQGLLGAKLMALLAFSDPVQNEFQVRYGQPLLGLVTTSIAGPHCPIFNRIRVNKIRPSNIYDGYANELYRHIGQTSGCTTVMLSDETISYARRLLELVSPERLAPTQGMRSNLGRDRIIRNALGLCGIGRKVLNMNEKGLYFACLNETNRRLLEQGSGEGVPVVGLNVGDATCYWKENWLGKVLQRTGGLDRVRSFSRTHAALSMLIGAPASGC